MIISLFPKKETRGKKIVKTVGFASTLAVSQAGLVKPKNRLSVGELSLLLFVSLFAYSILSGIDTMILLSFAVLLLGGIYEGIRTSKWRKMKVFFSKIYFGSGFEPYILSLLTVSLTILVTVWLDQNTPAFMHYQFHPFTDMQGSITMLPIMKAFETGYGLLIVATVVGLLMLVPYLAYEEEKLFRYKRVSIPAILRGCILFGPVHVISGIPLYACVALSMTGLLFSFYYGYCYYRMLRRSSQSERRSEFAALFPVTALHTMHNSIFVGFMTFYVFS